MWKDCFNVSPMLLLTSPCWISSALYYSHFLLLLYEHVLLISISFLCLFPDATGEKQINPLASVSSSFSSSGPSGTAEALGCSSYSIFSVSCIMQQVPSSQRGCLSELRAGRRFRVQRDVTALGGLGSLTAL